MVLCVPSNNSWPEAGLISTTILDSELMIYIQGTITFWSFFSFFFSYIYIYMDIVFLLVPLRTFHPLLFNYPHFGLKFFFFPGGPGLK